MAGPRKKSGRTVTVTAHVSDYVDVVVDLSLVDEDDLRNELRERGQETSVDYEEIDKMLRELYEAFHAHDNDRAMQIARELSETSTGRILA